ncbi:hypothetical protein VTK26DRAFT_1873 [Humicola hyalothermophila]
MSLRNRDTGFPEGFCGTRNTTLPHPEANLSPNACITEDDVSPLRALTRHRMTFLECSEGQRAAADRGGEGGSTTSLSALGRSAINSLRNGELPSFPGIDAFLPSSRDADSIASATSSDGTSDGMSNSSRGPDSPRQPAGSDKFDPRDGVAADAGRRDPREHRRKHRHRRKSSGFVSRLLHK